MSKDTKYLFNRWETRSKTSWAWRVFKKHNDELMGMYTTFHTTKKFTYKNLSQNNAQWTDKPNKHFDFSKDWKYGNFDTLKDWSHSFNELDNWINLNALVTISSALETYIATIILLALESDSGVLFGKPKKIDGIEILKYNRNKYFDPENIVESCTKGTWQSRLNSYEKVFGHVPEFLSNHISELEHIRISRNNIAHSFGRDIKASRNTGELTTIPIQKITDDKLLKLHAIAWNVAKEIDNHLFKSHICEYNAVLFYHKLYPSLNKDVHQSIRAMEFKKEIGRHGDIPAGKDFCKGLVSYYESL